MKKARDNLAGQHQLLWQGNTAWGKDDGTSTGFPALDQALPTRGWPNNALTELILPYWGIGELRLLLPAMRYLNRQDRQIVWIAPPYLPYAPALVNAGLNLHYVLVVDAQSGNISWAMERLLYAESCGMVLAWPVALSALETRRLQLAAEAGGTVGVVLHTVDAKWQATCAALRLQIESSPSGVAIDLIKTRGLCNRRQILVAL